LAGVDLVVTVDLADALEELEVVEGEFFRLEP
jgi:hypothetical protein